MQALVDVLDDMDWKSFTIIYENDEGLVRLQEVLKRHGPGDPPITVRQLGPGPDYRQVQSVSVIGGFKVSAEKPNLIMVFALVPKVKYFY